MRITKAHLCLEKDFGRGIRGALDEGKRLIFERDSDNGDGLKRGAQSAEQAEQERGICQKKRRRVGCGVVCGFRAFVQGEEVYGGSCDDDT